MCQFLSVLSWIDEKIHDVSFETYPSNFGMSLYESICTLPRYTLDRMKRWHDQGRTSAVCPSFVRAAFATAANGTPSPATSWAAPRRSAAAPRIAMTTPVAASLPRNRRGHGCEERTDMKTTSCYIWITSVLCCSSWCPFFGLGCGCSWCSLGPNFHGEFLSIFQHPQPSPAPRLTHLEATTQAGWGRTSNVTAGEHRWRMLWAHVLAPWHTSSAFVFWTRPGRKIVGHSCHSSKVERSPGSWRLWDILCSDLGMWMVSICFYQLTGIPHFPFLASPPALANHKCSAITSSAFTWPAKITYLVRWIS